MKDQIKYSLPWSEYQNGFVKNIQLNLQDLAKRISLLYAKTRKFCLFSFIFENSRRPKKKVIFYCSGGGVSECLLFWVEEAFIRFFLQISWLIFGWAVPKFDSFIMFRSISKRNALFQKGMETGQNKKALPHICKWTSGKK